VIAAPVLASGAAGSIGSHAVKALRAEDIDVIVQTPWRWREAHPDGCRKVQA
jgi:UDP-glucose 4-epimerase